MAFEIAFCCISGKDIFESQLRVFKLEKTFEFVF
jgi:hypothetical protein